MVTPVYTYEIRDLRTNVLMETVPLVDVSFEKVLCDSGTFKGALPLPLYTSQGALREAYELTMPAHTCVYVYRGTQPIWGGVIWTSSYDSETGKVALGAADWWSLLDHRKILPLLPANAFTDTSVLAKISTVYTGLDQNAIARNLLTQAQLTVGDLGIVADAGNSGFTRTRTYPGYSTTPLGDELRNLSRDLDGPDIRFDVDPAGADGKPVRRMLLGNPKLGQVGAPWVWEYGGNVKSYVWPRDATRMRTRSFAIGEGSDKNTPIGVAEDVNLYALGWPKLEDDTTYSRVQGDTGTLINHAVADQAVNRLPVTLPTIVVRGELPPTVAEVSPGDDGRLLIEDEFHGYAPPRGSRGLDARMRIVKMKVTVSAEELATYTMAPLLGV